MNFLTLYGTRKSIAMFTSRLWGSGDGLQIRRIATNILNKKLRETDKSGPPTWGLHMGLQLLAEMLN
jgi:hypothetical protein